MFACKHLQLPKDSGVSVSPRSGRNGARHERSGGPDEGGLITRGAAGPYCVWPRIGGTPLGDFAVGAAVRACPAGCVLGGTMLMLRVGSSVLRGEIGGELAEDEVED